MECASLSSLGRSDALEVTMQPGHMLGCVLLSLLSVTAAVLARTSERQHALVRAADSSKDGVLQLDTKKFDQLTATPRDYSVTVYFTVNSPQIPCPACDIFAAPFRFVARGWRKHSDRHRHVFAELDAVAGDNKQVFFRHGFTHVPVIFYYPATEGPHAASNGSPIEINAGEHGYSAEGFAESMSSLLKTKLRANKPIFTPWNLGIVAVTAATVAIGVIAAPHVRLFDGLKSIATVVCLGMVLVFTSGYMWNRIRKPPYMIRGRDGSPQIFSSGYMEQTGIESNAIAALYGALALVVVILTNVAPAVRNKNVQRLVVLLSSVAFLFLFSVVLDAFRTKKCVSTVLVHLLTCSPAYPFRLLI